MMLMRECMMIIIKCMMMIMRLVHANIDYDAKLLIASYKKKLMQ